MRLPGAALASNPNRRHGIRYAFVYPPAGSSLNGRHISVELTAPAGTSAQMWALSVPASSPVGFFSSCPTRMSRGARFESRVAGSSSTASLSISSTARGVWLGVATWATVPSVTLSVKLAPVSCVSMNTHTLAFCKASLPTTIETPTSGWPGAPAITLTQRDQHARAVSEVVTSYTSASCRTAVDSLLCAKSFPVCGGANTTVLPVCAKLCSDVISACKDFVSVLGQLPNGCAGANSETASTCYGFTSAAASIAHVTLRAWCAVAAVGLLTTRRWGCA